MAGCQSESLKCNWNTRLNSIFLIVMLTIKSETTNQSKKIHTFHHLTEKASQVVWGEIAGIPHQLQLTDLRFTFAWPTGPVVQYEHLKMEGLFYFQFYAGRGWGLRSPGSAQRSCSGKYWNLASNIQNICLTYWDIILPKFFFKCNVRKFPFRNKERLGTRSQVAADALMGK